MVIVVVESEKVVVLCVFGGVVFLEMVMGKVIVCCEIVVV